MHDALIMAVPTLAVLFGNLLNRQDESSIPAEMAQLRADMKADSSALRSETITLRDSIHRDMIGLHERLAVVEAKTKSISSTRKDLPKQWQRPTTTQTPTSPSSRQKK